jgi:hypothetical protein
MVARHNQREVGIERPNNDSNGNEVIIIITAQGSLEVVMY